MTVQPFIGPLKVGKHEQLAARPLPDDSSAVVGGPMTERNDQSPQPLPICDSEPFLGPNIGHPDLSSISKEHCSASVETTGQGKRVAEIKRDSALSDHPATKLSTICRRRKK